MLQSYKSLRLLCYKSLFWGREEGSLFAAQIFRVSTFWQQFVNFFLSVICIIRPGKLIIFLPDLGTKLIFLRDTYLLRTYYDIRKVRRKPRLRKICLICIEKGRLYYTWNQITKLVVPD